jgi:hypothetical protein
MNRIRQTKTIISTLIACTLVSCVTFAGEKPDAGRAAKMKAAKVKILRPAQLKPTPIEELKASPKWLSGSTIHCCVGAEIGHGFVEFEVVESGHLFLAVNFQYQGNPSGQGPNVNWPKERWKKQDFINAGWSFAEGSVEGPSSNDQQIHELCGKMVKKGETYKLRCNKYIPPFPIEATRDSGGNSKSYSWTGEVPFQKLQQFKSQVLAPIQAAEESKITVTVEFTPKEGQEDRLVEKVNAGLKELGLDGQVEPLK